MTSCSLTNLLLFCSLIGTKMSGHIPASGISISLHDFTLVFMNSLFDSACIPISRIKIKFLTPYSVQSGGRPVSWTYLWNPGPVCSGCWQVRRFPCVHELSVLVRDRMNSPPCRLRRNRRSSTFSLTPSRGRYFVSPQSSPELNPRWCHFIKMHLWKYTCINCRQLWSLWCFSASIS